MKIAAILLNYNSSDDCRFCIDDLLRQTEIETEIVVVDNGSTPEDRREVEQLCREKNCTFIASSDNRGYNAGNNIGLRYANSAGYEFALICNPDMQLSQSDYLKELLSPMLQDKTIAACGGTVLTPQGIHQNPRNYSGRGNLHNFGWIPYMLRRKNLGVVPNWVDNPTISHFCQGLNGCCLMLRMSFVRRIGYFDERIFLYGEEGILASQVKSAKMKLFYTDKTHAVHNHRENPGSNKNVAAKHWKDSQLLFIRDYSGYSRMGKYFATLSLCSYFFALNIVHRLRNHKKHARCR
ncbi:MAG: glycosyltransferase family 2 protein [Victivallales bacterium]|jgi:GT2 family glycosyltransferase|nr:glycosyltransferase family 2 protein [Victivallales bacterium]